jgi:hypothetical protein
VAKPGAQVTLWVLKQGQAQPTSIGKVRASKRDGSWTLTADRRLGDGNYAVTASQSGDTSPPTVLYSLTPDDQGGLPNALVIQTSRAHGHASGHTATASLPRGHIALRLARARSPLSKRSLGH